MTELKAQIAWQKNVSGLLHMFIRKKGFGPRETQVALGNFLSPKEYLTLQASLDIFVKVKILHSSLDVFQIVTFLHISLGVSQIVTFLYISLGVSLGVSLSVLTSLWSAFKALQRFGSLKDSSHNKSNN